MNEKTVTQGKQHRGKARVDGESVDASARLVRNILKQLRVITAAARQHFHAQDAEGGLSGAQRWMLVAIAETPGITVSRLGAALSVHISTASALLDKLVKAGLVERRRGEDDRRVVNLRLTEQGLSALDRAPRPFSGQVPHALACLPEASLTRLHEDLALLIRQIHQPDQEAVNKPLPTLVN